jgi:hypothetical protein
MRTTDDTQAAGKKRETAGVMTMLYVYRNGNTNTEA